MVGTDVPHSGSHQSSFQVFWVSVRLCPAPFPRWHCLLSAGQSMGDTGNVLCAWATSPSGILGLEQGGGIGWYCIECRVVLVRQVGWSPARDQVDFQPTEPLRQSLGVPLVLPPGQTTPRNQIRLP